MTEELFSPEIFGLAFACPKGSREQTCPLIELEGFNLLERVNWIKEAGSGKINEILGEHNMCSCK